MRQMSNKMTSSEVLEWVKSFPKINSMGDDINRAFIDFAVRAWHYKDGDAFIYNLQLSKMNSSEIVHFAMRSAMVNDAAEVAFWNDLKLYFDGCFDFRFYEYSEQDD